MLDTFIISSSIDQKCENKTEERKTWENIKYIERENIYMNDFSLRIVVPFNVIET